MNIPNRLPNITRDHIEALQARLRAAEARLEDAAPVDLTRPNILLWNNICRVRGRLSK